MIDDGLPQLHYCYSLLLHIMYEFSIHYPQSVSTSSILSKIFVPGLRRLPSTALLIIPIVIDSQQWVIIAPQSEGDKKKRHLPCIYTIIHDFILLF